MRGQLGSSLAIKHLRLSGSVCNWGEMVRYPLSLRLSANRLDCQDESRSPHPRHTLLGQALADALNGLAYSVSTEEGLALRSQRLDMMIIEPRTAYPLLPAADFCSYAIATQFPRKLIKQLPAGGCQRSQTPGLYRLQTGTREVRLVVINELRQLPRQPMVVQGAAHWDSIGCRLAHAKYALWPCGKV